MSATPKTIQIFLPGGDPHGIRVAEITTRIVQAIEVPRSLLATFQQMPESSQVAVYFLLGNADATEVPKVYVGQTGDLRARLQNHNKEKDFWERVLVLISRTNSFTQTHALFLEWHCLQAVRKAGRYADENGNGGSKPHTPAPLEADCLEIFDTANILLATLGYSLFEPLAKGCPLEFFHCTRAGVDGHGIYSSEGFVVLKGSVGRTMSAASAIGTSVERLRNKLIETGVLRVEGDQVVFEKDHLFGSPSTAASAVLGCSSNGWVDWRTERGQTLDALKRQIKPQQ